MAGAVGLTEQRYAPGANHVAAECLDAHNPLHMAMDGTNPYFVYDPAKCIVCYRCVRACEEVQGTFALTIEGRGFDSRIVAGHGRGLPRPRNASPAAPASRPARPAR